MSDELMQIGSVSDRVGLSLRTVRYYEEVGLVVPAQRSPGGFRLYSEDNVAQLRLITQMKPLDFTLDQMRDLLDTVAALDEEGPDDGAPDGDAVTSPDPTRRADLEDRLAAYRSIVDARIETLREQLRRAESFSTQLRSRLPLSRRD